MREESVRCVICSSSAATQKSLRLNPYAVFIHYLILFYSKNHNFIYYYFRIKWNGVLRFNRNKKRKCVSINNDSPHMSI